MSAETKRCASENYRCDDSSSRRDFTFPLERIRNPSAFRITRQARGASLDQMEVIP